MMSRIIQTICLCLSPVELIIFKDVLYISVCKWVVEVRHLILSLLTILDVRRHRNFTVIQRTIITMLGSQYLVKLNPSGIFPDPSLAEASGTLSPEGRCRVVGDVGRGSQSLLCGKMLLLKSCAEAARLHLTNGDMFVFSKCPSSVSWLSSSRRKVPQRVDV